MPFRLAFSGMLFFALAVLAQPQTADTPRAKDAIILKADSPTLPAHARARLGQLGGFRCTGAAFGATMALDGKLIAVISSNNGGIKIIDASSGKVVQSLQTQFIAGQGGLAFSDDGSTLALQDFQNVSIWEVATGKLLRQLQNRDNAGRTHGPSLSRDGKMIALSAAQFGNNQTGEVSAMETATGKIIGPFRGIHNFNIRAVMAPDGKSMVSFGQNLNRGGGGFDQDSPRTLQFWDVSAGKEAKKIKLEFGPQGAGQIVNAAYAPDGKTLAVVSGGSTFHFIDLASGKETRRFAGRRGAGWLRFSPEGDILVAYGFAGAPQAWEVKSGKRIDLDEGPKSRLHAIAFPGNNRILAMGTLGNALHWWDANLGDQPSPFHGHLTTIAAVAFSADGKSVVSAGVDQAILWWDAASLKEMRRLTLPDDDARFGGGRGRGALAVSADGRYAATAGDIGFGGIRLWNLKTGRAILDFEGPRGHGVGIGLAFSPDGSKLAAAESENPSVWDIGTGQALLKLPPNNARHALQPGIVAFSPDGKLIAVHASLLDPMGRQTSDLVVWNLADVKERHRSNRALTHANNSGSLAFSPDNRSLAIAAANGEIALLNALTGEEASRFASANRHSIPQLAFSPDRRFLAVGFSPYNPGHGNGNVDEPVIEIWELASGQLRDRFVGHTGGITCVAFSADGATLASGSTDTTILLWDFTGKSGTQAEPLSKDDLAAGWKALAEKNARTAETVQRLVRSSATIAYLKEHFLPARRQDADAKRVAKLIADLDSASFKDRDAAMRELKQLGTQAASALKAGLTKASSAEATHRIQDLLDLLVRTDVTPQELQAIRGVEVLERIGNPEARELLAALAKGDPAARGTQEAAAALKRLERK